MRTLIYVIHAEFTRGVRHFRITVTNVTIRCKVEFLSIFGVIERPLCALTEIGLRQCFASETPDP